MLVQGHRIRVVSVNLADQWETIEARLLNLIDSAPLFENHRERHHP
jgi:hypothetical protein